jgi:hypothetical protein
MLQKLLDLLEEHPDRLTQEQICAQLGVSPASLQSMLDILVRKGKLSSQAVRGDGICAAPCEDCPVLGRCSLTKEYQETIYRAGS